MNYSAEIINKWVSNPDVERFGRQMKTGICYLLAVDNGVPIGFGALDVVNAQITALFVHPTHAGKGVGRYLLLELEHVAVDRGLDMLQLDSSLNAQDFYERNGYGGGKPGKYRLSAGIEIDSVQMTKRLHR